MEIYIWNFVQPVAFYGYTSRVVSPIIAIESDDENEDAKDIASWIKTQFYRAHKLNRRNGYTSTMRDNKTVIAMSDGRNTIYAGWYDGSYFIGLGVDCEDPRSEIKLNDVHPLDWYHLLDK